MELWLPTIAAVMILNRIMSTIWITTWTEKEKKHTYGYLGTIRDTTITTKPFEEWKDDDKIFFGVILLLIGDILGPLGLIIGLFKLLKHLMILTIKIFFRIGLITRDLPQTVQSKVYQVKENWNKNEAIGGELAEPIDNLQ